MAAVVRSNIMSHEMDTTALFEKFKIDEIRDIEKKTRADIERKKEDLRQMVGERYRDLIEAADTITEMKICAENVTASIARMQGFCHNLKQMTSLHAPPTKYSARKEPLKKLRSLTLCFRKKDEHGFYGIATQIKLLHDMPEKIWVALDSRSYLQATRLFLLARHVNTALQLDSHQSALILARFPVLSTQWAAIGHFKSTILQTCRETLKEADISNQLAAECLCSIMLLEDSTPRQVFNELLLLRTTAVQQIFSGEQTSSIKDQVCQTMMTIITTIRQIYAVFYSGSENTLLQVPCNLLMSTLETVTNKGPVGCILEETFGSVGMKHLPKAVTNYRPVLHNHATPISPNHLQANCQQWMETCTASVSAGLDKLLGFVATIKGLAAIRDHVWTVLTQDEKMNEWDIVCKLVLDKSISVWQDLFQQHFVNRSKVILQELFDGALGTGKQQIAKVLADLGSEKENLYTEVERNLSSYIWKESPQDIPANAAWLNVSKKSLSDAGPLLMKAKAYTPAVQSLCLTFDGKLKGLLEDCTHYLSPVNKDVTGVDAGPFDRFADETALKSFLQSACQSCMSKLLEHLKMQLYASKKQLGNVEDHQGNQVIINRVLLLGRLSVALCELCPHLQQCMAGNTAKLEDTRLVKKAAAKGLPENPAWKMLMTNLQEFSQESFRLWVECVTAHHKLEFSAALLSNTGPNLLLATTRWDEITIKEETEDGKTIQSTIRVPMQPSWYIQSLLYKICEEINRVGGHTLSRRVLQELVNQISTDILEVYETLLKQDKPAQASEKSSHPVVLPLTQTRALQLLFDLKYLSAVLPRKDDSKESSNHDKLVQVAIEKLESYIDPFDLDVFMPYIQTHLSRQTQRSAVLLGALTSLDRHSSFLTGGRLTQAGHQEQHNVLPLTTSHSRFPLLPLSVQTRSSVAPPIVQPPKPKTSLQTPGSPPPTAPAPAEQSSGFLGTMSTIWFTKAK